MRTLLAFLFAAFSCAAAAQWPGYTSKAQTASPVGSAVAPKTVTASSYTVLASDNTIIANFAGIVTLTFPAASGAIGRRYRALTITANTVVSASSNIVPCAGGAAAAAILAATAGKWAEMESDGTNWVITACN